MANTCDNIYYDEPSLTSSCKGNEYENDNGGEQFEEELYFTEIDGNFSNTKLRIKSQFDGKDKVYFSKTPTISKHKPSEPGVYDELSLTTDLQSHSASKFEDIRQKTKTCRHFKTKIIIVLTVLVIVLSILLIGLYSAGDDRSNENSTSSLHSNHTNTTTSSSIFPALTTTEYKGKNESQIEIEMKCRNSLPNEFSNNRECRKLNINCQNLHKKCDLKLGNKKEVFGSNKSAKKCIQRLSQSDRASKIKNFCKLTCNQCNLCQPLSQLKWRCGPKWGGRCNKNLEDEAIYCNTENGWCGNTDDHKNAQSDDIFDWLPKSCYDQT